MSVCVCGSTVCRSVCASGNSPSLLLLFIVNRGARVTDGRGVCVKRETERVE